MHRRADAVAAVLGDDPVADPVAAGRLLAGGSAPRARCRSAGRPGRMTAIPACRAASQAADSARSAADTAPTGERDRGVAVPALRGWRRSRPRRRSPSASTCAADGMPCTICSLTEAQMRRRVAVVAQEGRDARRPSRITCSASASSSAVLTPGAARVGDRSRAHGRRPRRRRASRRSRRASSARCHAPGMRGQHRPAPRRVLMDTGADRSCRAASHAIGDLLDRADARPR